jgi:hypothetical protein
MMLDKRWVTILIIALALMLAGCQIGKQAAEASTPTVQITSPAVGSEVTLGEEVVVQATASDVGGPGVKMVDLYLGDTTTPITRDEVSGDPVETYNASLAWTPATAGSVTLRVIAYRADNVPSPAATITLSVVEPPATPTPEPSPTPEAQPPYTFKVIQETNVYCGPGETYPVMGVLEVDEEVEVEAIDPTGDWYQIQYLESIGWVHKDYVEPVDELGELPESTEEAACVAASGQGGGAGGGAAGGVGAGVPCVPPACVPVNFCGDGFCLAPLETALLCPVDCTVGAAVCGDGTCDAGEDAVHCPFDCAGGAIAVCGNGACDLGENNNNCPADCPTSCGNLACEAGEDANNCAIDCGLGACGDGVCNFFENPANCPADCAAAVCGDGICNLLSENHATCPADCP